MKKIGSFFITLGIMLVMIFSLTGCGNDAKPMVTDSYHNKPSDFSFYKDTLFWSDTVWDFSGITYPILKWESN